MKMTKEQKQCPFCHDEDDTQQALGEFTFHVNVIDADEGFLSIAGDNLIVEGEGHDTEISINYCPWCGRRLEAK